ncbi:(2Fe-2S)-binding protein [uncultured Roseibium sp.]|uniref:(2Fe-2S)-binding protein n=1 Tax=uncultured Roseibium sp. TaxID=1936171 RepID=UPI00374C9246
MTEKSVTFRVNGEDRAVRTGADIPLLYALREELDLKGARFGCGDAACGACTVIVDGVAVTSCDLPVSAVAGKSIETVESLDTDPPHPLIDAAIDQQAAQCGYCLPGILMAAKALLEQNKQPDRADIIAALDGNLCRCGTHTRILRAIEQAAGMMAEAGE